MSEYFDYMFNEKDMVFYTWKNSNTVLITVSAQDLGLLQIIKSKQPARAVKLIYAIGFG